IFGLPPLNPRSINMPLLIRGKRRDRTVRAAAGLGLVKFYYTGVVGKAWQHAVQSALADTLLQGFAANLLKVIVKTALRLCTCYIVVKRDRQGKKCKGANGNRGNGTHGKLPFFNMLSHKSSNRGIP